MTTVTTILDSGQGWGVDRITQIMVASDESRIAKLRDESANPLDIAAYSLALGDTATAQQQLESSSDSWRRTVLLGDLRRLENRFDESIKIFAEICYDDLTAHQVAITNQHLGKVLLAARKYKECVEVLEDARSFFLASDDDLSLIFTESALLQARYEDYLLQLDSANS